MPAIRVKQKEPCHVSTGPSFSATGGIRTLTVEFLRLLPLPLRYGSMWGISAPKN